jgi:hypothetical protein
MPDTPYHYSACLKPHTRCLFSVLFFSSVLAFTYLALQLLKMANKNAPAPAKAAAPAPAAKPAAAAPAPAKAAAPAAAPAKPVQKK